MNLMNKFFFFATLWVILLTMAMGGCSATPVRHSPVTVEQYQEVTYDGQVPVDQVDELKSRYPAGFWQQGEIVMINGAEKRISVRPFGSSTLFQNQAWSTSRIFADRLADSKYFVLVERDRLDAMLDEFELNQSGLTNMDDGPQTGSMEGADIIVTGDIVQLSDGFRIQARAVDMNSGRVLLSEKSGVLEAVSSQAAEVLAARFISRLAGVAYH